MVKNALFTPQYLFLFEKCCFKNMTTFSVRPHIQKIHQGVANRGFAPFCLEGLGAAVPLIAKKILDLSEA
jgi:hypothetical protein